MTSQAKPASKWGSFFQQAVAGVESRLDTILADDERPSTPFGKVVVDTTAPTDDALLRERTAVPSQ